jgi:hypothetical protein
MATSYPLCPSSCLFGAEDFALPLSAEDVIGATNSKFRSASGATFRGNTPRFVPFMPDAYRA